MKLLKVSLFFLIAPVLSSAQSIPAIKAKALDNSEITLPQSEQQAGPDSHGRLLS